jgi:hypothetical protein
VKNIHALKSATLAVDRARCETIRIAQEKDRELAMYESLLHMEEDAHEESKCKLNSLRASAKKRKLNSLCVSANKRQVVFAE